MKTSFDRLIKILRFLTDGRIKKMFNPINAGLFEGSSGVVVGGDQLTPLLISRRTIPISIKPYTIVEQTI